MSQNQATQTAVRLRSPQAELIGTTEAAFLLNISAVRLRQLLQQGRVVGAYKQGRRWVIPLIKGMPKIKPGSRGPKGTWGKRPRTAETRIHINRSVFADHRANGANEPPISVIIGSKTRRCHEVEIPAKARVVYSPKHPLPCGAVLWIEVDPNQPITMRKYKKLKSVLTA